MKISSILTPGILAKKLGVTEQTLLGWRSHGLPTIRIGKCIMILEESFLKWLKTRETHQDASGDKIGKSG